MVTSIWPTTSTQTQTHLQSWVVPGISQGWYTVPSGLVTLAEQFSPISLDEMEAVSLLDRIDTKYVLSTKQLLDALAELQPNYWILSIQGQRLNHYRTLYFDTPEYGLYRMHVNGQANRYKVRSREYADTRLSFLEVKHRTPKDRTIKDRLSTTYPMTSITTEAEIWLKNFFPFNSQSLEPKLWNTFTRITLVSKTLWERVTLDVDLAFYTTKRMVRLDNISVAEVKMERVHCRSPFMQQMHAQRIHPQGFSKYCIGVGLLCDGVKKNALKPKLLWLDKITRGANTYE